MKGGADDIFQASQNGNLARVKELVEEGVNVNARFRGISTALVNASQSGHLDIVKYLVEKGANVNARDGSGMTPMDVGILFKHLEIVKYLVEKGANVNAKDINGGTHLMSAVYVNRPDIVKYLIEKGADVYARNKKGENACNRATSPELKALLCLPPIPPVPTEERNIPSGSETEITYEEIKNGDVLVDFNKEYQHKRYYDAETVARLQSNPHTREPIGKKTVYTAKIVAGGSRKTRKQKRKSKKTRKHK